MCYYSCFFQNFTFQRFARHLALRQVSTRDNEQSFC